MYILGIHGSPRKNGNSHTVLAEILAGAEHAGASTEEVQLSSFSIEGCIGCERCRKDKTCTQFFDGMHLLYPKIEAADGLIIGSPAYNYNVTPWMKAFIDRLYPFFNFTEPRPGPYTARLAGKGRQALVFAVCEQLDPKEAGYTLPSMRDAIRVLGYQIQAEMTFPGHFYLHSAQKCDETKKRAFAAGKDFADQLAHHKASCQ